MVNVRGIEPSGVAINPARDSARQTESAAYKEDGSEEKRERRSRGGRKRPGPRRSSFFIVLARLSLRSLRSHGVISAP